MHAYQVPIYAYPLAPLVPMVELSMQVEQAALKALNVAAAVHRAGIPILAGLYAGAPWEQILHGPPEPELETAVPEGASLRAVH
jgi:hypothetical protein